MFATPISSSDNSSGRVIGTADYIKHILYADASQQTGGISAACEERPAITHHLSCQSPVMKLMSERFHCACAFRASRPLSTDRTVKEPNTRTTTTSETITPDHAWTTCSDNSTLP